jgi:hypothetical protein
VADPKGGVDAKPPSSSRSRSITMVDKIKNKRERFRGKRNLYLRNASKHSTVE